MRRLGTLVWSLLFCIAFFGGTAYTHAADASILLTTLQFSGDFRYRHEGIFVENAPNRLRHRLRLRVGASAEINEYFDAAIRLATSTPQSSDVGDPISTNQDLGGGLAPKAVWVDRAYATFQPTGKLRALLGKFGVPYHNTDLLFDPDLNLEGIAVAFDCDEEKRVRPFARIGGYWIQERSTGPDQALFGGQAGARFVHDELTLTGAIAYYDYTNVKGHPLILLPNRNFGNTVVQVAPPTFLYVNDYDLLDVNAQVKYKFNTLDVTVLGNYIQNTAPDSNNTAWMAGLQLKGKAPLEWDFGYNYRVLDADAVIGAFSDSDFGGGGTNAEGHRFSGGISPVEDTRLGLTWFVNTRDPDGAAVHYERLMVDLEIKW